MVKFPRPRKIKDVRSFLGLTDFFRKYIKGYANIAAPLNKMKRKSFGDFRWGEEQEEAFLKLKEALTHAPVLQYYNPNARIRLDTDASGYGIGGILQQTTNDKDWYPVEFASRMLSEDEKKLDTTTREALAVAYCLKKFRPYIFGKQIEVRTDHSALKTLLTLPDPHGKLARLAMEIANQDIDIIHRPGSKMQHVDCLSRYPVRNMEQPLVRATKKQIEDAEELIQLAAKGNAELFAQMQNEEPKLKKIIDKLRNSKGAQNSEVIIGSNYALIQGLLYRINKRQAAHPWQLVVPMVLRTDILKLTHDNIDSGHGGFYKTYLLTRQRYYWDRMVKDIAQYVQSCEKCQLFNARNSKADGHRKVYPPPIRPFQRVAIDYIGPFHRTFHGKVYALVIIDYCTRYLIVIPSSSATTESSKTIMEEHVFWRFGYPREVVTDGGQHFKGEGFNGFLKQLNIKHIIVAPYSPESNGVVERSNRDIKNNMSKYCNENATDWDHLCYSAAFCHNTQHHLSIGTTPYRLVHGREPVLRADLLTPIIQQQIPMDIDQHEQDQSQAIERAVEKTVQQQMQRNQKDNKGRKQHSYKIGDLILVNVEKTTLRPRWEGPFEVIGFLGDMNLFYSCHGQEKRAHLHQVKKWRSKEPWQRNQGLLEKQFQDRNNNEQSANNGNSEGTDQPKENPQVSATVTGTTHHSADGAQEVTGNQQNQSASLPNIGQQHQLSHGYDTRFRAQNSSFVQQRILTQPTYTYGPAFVPAQYGIFGFPASYYNWTTVY